MHNRLTRAGIEVEEAKITTLSYAPEIAAVMLKSNRLKRLLRSGARLCRGPLVLLAKLSCRWGKMKLSSLVILRSQGWSAIYCSAVQWAKCSACFEYWLIVSRNFIRKWIRLFRMGCNYSGVGFLKLHCVLYMNSIWKTYSVACFWIWHYFSDHSVLLLSKNIVDNEKHNSLIDIIIPYR